MTEHVPGVPRSPATTRAPADSGAYDPSRAHQVQAFVPEPDQHFRLPDDVRKPQAIAMTCRALRLLGASERAIAVWRHVADMTERRAWHADDRAPVNWKRQCDLAREMEIGERQFRRIEAELARMGVLARATADNGYRGRRTGQSVRDPVSCGLSLEPAIANHRALAAIVAEAGIAEEARQEALLNARTARKRVGLLIASLKDVEMRRWAKGRLVRLEEDARPASPRVASSGDLSRWHAALLALEDAIREALAPLPAAAAEEAGPDRSPADGDDDVDPDGIRARDSGPVDSVGIQHEMSAAPDIRVRCHIQPTTESRSICKEPAPTASPGDMAGTAPGTGFRIPAQGDGTRAHAPPLSPAMAARLTERDIREIASDDVAFWLDATDWQVALPHILRELGVNVSAWHDACDAMGEPLAFLALLVIDRNRFHPDRPILNPGGALRAFTGRARRGQLDLTRSILGIRERERQGRQPKGPLAPRRPS